MKKRLRVWWVPQIRMTPFYVLVSSVEEGVKLMSVLADYDAFQYEHRVKPDYANTGGLMAFDPDDDTDGPEGSWSDWCNEETGEDDPVEYLRLLREADDEASARNEENVAKQ